MLVNSKMCLQVWVKTLFFLREQCPESPFKINPFHSSILKIIGAGSYLEQTRAAGCQTTSLLFTGCEAEWEKFWRTGRWQSSAQACRDPARSQSDQQVAFVPVLEMEGDLCQGRKHFRRTLATQRKELWFYRRGGWCECQNPFHSSVEGPSTFQQFLTQTLSATPELKNPASKKHSVIDSSWKNCIDLVSVKQPDL